MFGLLLVLIGLSALFHFVFADAAWPNYFTLGVLFFAVLLYIIRFRQRKSTNV